MKIKILAIFVCVLLIAATVLPVTGTIIQDVKSENKTGFEISSLGEVKDQYQENCGECEYFDNYAWQQFVPTKSKLLRVEVSIAQWYSNSPDITLSIERPLGHILTSESLPVSKIPEWYCDWVSFDVPDITLTPGETYYIVLSYPLGGEYSWCGTWGNPYPKGESDIHPDWDWCFQTWASSTEVEPIPILDFINIHGGLLGTTVVLMNFGEGIAYDIKWSMEITEGSLGPLNVTLFLPQKANGEIPKLAPGEEKEIGSLILGLGQATVNFYCKYTIMLNSLRSEVEAEAKQEYRDQCYGVWHTFPEGAQPTKEWKIIEEFYYDEYGEVLLKYGEILNMHNVRCINSISSDLEFQSACSFTNGEGILNEGWLTKGSIESGDWYWELELLDGA